VLVTEHRLTPVANRESLVRRTLGQASALLRTGDVADARRLAERMEIAGLPPAVQAERLGSGASSAGWPPRVWSYWAIRAISARTASARPTEGGISPPPRRRPTGLMPVSAPRANAPTPSSSPGVSCASSAAALGAPGSSPRRSTFFRPAKSEDEKGPVGRARGAQAKSRVSAAAHGGLADDSPRPGLHRDCLDNAP
jgi:hypothetical protein